MAQFEPYGEYEEMEEGKFEGIKSRLPLIIGIIVIAVVGWFVYDMFFGGIVEVGIYVKDTEGLSVKANTIKVFVPGESEATFSKTATSNASTKLKAGDYEVKVTASGYETYYRSHSVSAEEAEGIWSIVLEKDFAKDVELSELQVGNEIVGGQTIQGKVIINNNSSNVISVELVYDKPQKGLDVEFFLTSITLKAKDKTEAGFSITAAEDVETGKEGKEYSIKIRIKGTNKGKTLKITAFPAPKLDVPKSIKLSSDAGKEAKKEIKIRNKGKTAAKNLEVKVQITSSVLNDASKVLNWFFFSTTNKPEIKIDRIGTEYGANEASMLLKVKVPETAKKETISGQIVISSEMLTADITIPIELEIRKEVEAGVELKLPSTEIQVSYLKAEAKYEKVSKSLTVKNEGDITINPPLTIQVKNSTECTEEWLGEFSPSSIDIVMAINEGRNIWFKVSAPAEAFGGEKQDVVCIVIVYYTDPLTEEKKTVEKNLHVVAKQS